MRVKNSTISILPRQRRREQGRTSSMSASFAPSSFSNSATLLSNSPSLPATLGLPELNPCTPPAPAPTSVAPTKPNFSSSPLLDLAFSASPPSSFSPSPSSTPSSLVPSLSSFNPPRSPLSSCNCCSRTAGETSLFFPFPLDPSAVSPVGAEVEGAEAAVSVCSLLTSSSSSATSERSRRRRSRLVSFAEESEGSAME